MIVVDRRRFLKLAAAAGVAIVVSDLWIPPLLLALLREIDPDDLRKYRPDVRPFISYEWSASEPPIFHHVRADGAVSYPFGPGNCSGSGYRLPPPGIDPRWPVGKIIRGKVTVEVSRLQDGDMIKPFQTDPRRPLFIPLQTA